MPALADVVQENLPENSALKLATLKAVDEVADASKIILSSTGGIPPTKLQYGIEYFLGIDIRPSLHSGGFSR
jgi:carnitine 3-dehydrogenase